MDALLSSSASSAFVYQSYPNLHGTVRSRPLFRSLPWRSNAIGTSNNLNVFPQLVPDVSVSHSSYGKSTAIFDNLATAAGG